MQNVSLEGSGILLYEDLERLERATGHLLNRMLAADIIIEASAHVGGQIKHQVDHDWRHSKAE